MYLQNNLYVTKKQNWIDHKVQEVLEVVSWSLWARSSAEKHLHWFLSVFGKAWLLQTEELPSVEEILTDTGSTKGIVLYTEYVISLF